MSNLPENLVVEAQNDEYFVPAINFDAERGHCSIIGESYLEDAFDFYDRLIAWIDQYFGAGKEKLSIDIKLTYFNTSSSRALLDLLRNLKEHDDSGKNILVKWYYPEPDDGDMKEEAEDLMEESGLTMELVTYQEEDA